jgi:hypothetical protein
MSYMNLQTGQYSVSEQDIRNLNSNTSFTNPFHAPEEYVWVFPAPQPVYNSITQSCSEGVPVLTDKGHYEQTWSVVELFDNQTDRDNAIALAETQARKALVPISVSMRQARLALLAADLLDDVDAAVAASPRAAYIEYEYAQEVRRDSPLITTLMPALGFTEEQIDTLFIEASKI